MKHLGDITKINGYTAPPVNVVIGGSPCQDLSVAGKRAGLQVIWETLNGKGSCVWASEIEEFPTAVTKFRFPEED